MKTTLIVYLPLVSLQTSTMKITIAIICYIINKYPL